MPFTDETYFNIKRLHVAFAVSSLALLVVTVWMLVADHRRPWKVYQQTFRDKVEPWITEAKIREQRSETFLAREEQLRAALAEALRAVPDRALVEQFRAEVQNDAARRKAETPDFGPLQTAYAALAAAPSVEVRETLLKRLQAFLAAAETREENLQRRLRFRRAEFDQARSSYEAGVGVGLSPARLESLQQAVDLARKKIDELSAQLDGASAHRQTLERIFQELKGREDSARQALAEHRAALDRLDRTLKRQRWNFGKWLLRLPLLDALGRPLAIDQIWLPELTIDYNFRQVARFDRCTTCHQGIDKTMPETPSEPAVPSEALLTLQLATPGQAPAPEPGPSGESLPPSLEKTYGLALADRGILDPREPTVGLVLPKTPAADATLCAGDVILKINGRTIADQNTVRKYLLEEVAWGRPLTLQIRRGLPHPYASHPRLDLFVGALSPHPMAEFGCTVCHDGQGSATDFTWASHTPNDLDQRAAWRGRYGWLPNPNWDYPMLPARLAQSRCLKCHHEVSDLEPSRRFPDPPAANLLAGYHLIRQFGCFGCHEIKGFDDMGRQIGPDMRLAGTMQKVGPSLTDVAGRVSAAFLADRVADPAHFLPASRMPQFYALHEHLEGGNLADAVRFEAVEVRAITEYLLAASHPVQPLDPPPGVAGAPSAERGKRLFQIRGCLACHQHRDFPEGRATQGPELSEIGSKFNTQAGARWLHSWIRDPVRHSARTTMPNLFLEPDPGPQIEVGRQAEGTTPSSAPVAPVPHPAPTLDDSAPASNLAPANDRSTPVADPAADTVKLLPVPDPAASGVEKVPVTDPAADIVAWLLASAGWRPKEFPPLVESDLDELALMCLGTTFPAKLAAKYLKEGTPPPRADHVLGDAAVLSGEVSVQKKLQYVGRCTIRKRGCYGCHEIPGFEDAQPIGPALTDWGRKEAPLLAFEQINQFIAKCAAEPAGEASSRPTAAAAAVPAGDDADQGFFLKALLAHRREGFIWQKLRAPRSFDYQKARNKSYIEQLTMGKFTLTDQQREAIITFVLGLVGQPPAQKYVYQPDRRRKATIEGRKVLDKYACAECHTLQMERWSFQYDPAKFPNPPATTDFAFLRPTIPPEVVATSNQTDRRGLGHAEVTGMPRLDAQGKLQEDEDDEGNPVYAFALWEPTAIHGQVWTVGGPELLISKPQLTGRRPPWGGTLARLLYPVVLAEARAAGSIAPQLEAWGWLPPPLVNEGPKTQPAWLYGYLLNPGLIRPAAVLRMPRFNLSPAEAGKLVDYFSAVSDAEFPYTSSPAGRNNQPAAADQGRLSRLEAAMRILTDRTTYCTKCHLIGDYKPGGEIRTILAPRLDQVGRRVRPEYLRQWLANPKSALPYTAMPINFPPSGKPLGQDLYLGSSTEQLDAVLDLLINYDWYLHRRISIRGLVH